MPEVCACLDDRASVCTDVNVDTLPTSQREQLGMATQDRDIWIGLDTRQQLLDLQLSVPDWTIQVQGSHP